MNQSTDGQQHDSERPTPDGALGSWSRTRPAPGPCTSYVPALGRSLAPGGHRPRIGPPCLHRGSNHARNSSGHDLHGGRKL